MTSHPDLFFGIRGGGNNFGVVTQFVFQLYPHRRTVYAGTVKFHGSKLEQIVTLIRDKYALGEEPKAGMIHTITTSPDKKVVRAV